MCSYYCMFFHSKHVRIDRKNRAYFTHFYHPGSLERLS
uniref:Uncharacterized protein n=1 Tax=Arundo donax TaxID=35708 RepID=A0A0A9C4J3_ARUDO